MELSFGSSTVTTSRENMKISRGDSYTLRAQYHKSELEQNKKIIATAINMIWAGFGIIMIGIYLAFNGKTEVATITCASGIVSEFISGTIFWLVGKSTQNKLNYYTQLTQDEERDKLIEVINSSPNNKFREKMIEKLVDHHCE